MGQYRRISAFCCFDQLTVEIFQPNSQDLCILDRESDFPKTFAIIVKGQGHWGQYKVRWGNIGRIRENSVLLFWPTCRWDISSKLTGLMYLLWRRWFTYISYPYKFIGNGHKGQIGQHCPIQMDFILISLKFKKQDESWLLTIYRSIKYQRSSDPFCCAQ